MKIPISENPISINEIYRSLSPTSGFELIASQPHTMQSFTDSDVVPDVTYYYKTRAIHDDPELTSEFSAVRNYTTHSRNYNPTLIARALDDHTIELSLTDHESNDDYYHIGAENFNEFVSMPDSGTTTTFIHQDGVEPGKTFNYLVTVFMNTYPDANISYVAKATVTIPSEGECTASGTIRREVWSSVQGSNVSQIPVNTAPSAAQQLDMFEGPTNAGVHYGARISGYVCVPASGAYTFWIASNDHSELWMSTDDSPANKVMIASVNGATTPRQWNKYSSQESAPLELIAGKRYYIEALHKQGVGTDNIAVGWPLPDGTMERPIPGSRLSPFTGEVAPSCLASGTITREYWEGVEGSFVSEIPIHRDPDATNALTIFEGPSNAGIHYGTRIRGYICPPATGNYLFYIASNDHSELWLSSDADPANKVKLAFVRGATGIRQWDKYASQQSAPIALEEGMRYYIEALHKQGVGTDNIAVAWQLPDGTWEAPIPGRRLSPFEDAQPSATARMSDHAYYEQINIYPNPVQSGVAELSIAGYEGIEEIVETDIEILNMTGEVVFRDRISCGGDCGTYLMNIDKELVPGVYFVKMKANDARLSRRLLVK